MGTQRVVSGRLPIGGTQSESEALLAQTDEASRAGLSLKGVYDLRPALDAVAGGFCLTARQLEGIASSLQAVFDAKAAVLATDASGARLYPALTALAEPIDDGDGATVAAILGCVKGGSVLDAASEGLADVRARRAANKAALRALMNDQAKAAYQKGAADSRSVTIMRGRYCVGVKAGRSGDLPKGSVKVGQSQSGATHYFEPAPAVPLNNAEAVLDEAEREQEAAVLVALTRRVADRKDPLNAALAAAADLDVAAARAAHGAWLHGVRP
eukprot:351270-Chlamydomonas_euryale.AAC.1